MGNNAPLGEIRQKIVLFFSTIFLYMVPTLPISKALLPPYFSFPLRTTLKTLSPHFPAEFSHSDVTMLIPVPGLIRARHTA